MSFELHECVALQRDLPDRHLKAGDLGAVVHVYGEDAYEVEFVNASGGTTALLTLRTNDLRRVEGDEVLAVRRFDGAA